MITRRRIVYSGLLGALLLPLAGIALVAAGQAPVGATTAASTGANEADKEQFIAVAVARFAARLGKDEATVNAAFVAAVADAIDQAVRDGKLTQAQATEAKAETTKLGLKDFLLQGARSGKVEVAGPTDEVIQAMFEAAAATLGVAPDQIKREGKTIADLAKERGVDLLRVREAMLAAGKAKLAEAVQRGAVSQEQARKMEAVLPDIALKLTAAGRGVSAPARSVDQVIWETAARTLGLDPAQLKRAMADGKSITDLAAEKGIALQQIKDAMLAAGKAELTALVQQGKLTQVEADERQRGLPADIDKMIAMKPGGASRQG